MNTLIKILCLSSFLFSNEISYSPENTFSITYSKEFSLLGESKNKLKNAKFQGIERNKLRFTGPETFFGKTTILIDCNKIISITNEQNNNSYDDCAPFVDEMNKYISNPQEKHSFDIYPIRKFSFGGLFISLGGSVLLFNQIKVESGCEYDCGGWQNEINATQQLGYTLIIIGGFMLSGGN